MTREEAIKYFKRHLDLYCVDGISREAEEMAIKALSQEPCTDAVSREAIIYYIKGHIHEIITESGTDKNAHTNSILRALINGVETMPSVTPQPCDDAISRQAVKRILEDRFMELQKRHDDKRYETNYCLNTILDLPLVTPQSKTGHWIPVSERLPEKNVEVLATTEWGAVTIAEMYSANDWFIHEGTTNAETDEIAAWMPLPKPYELQESEE